MWRKEMPRNRPAEKVLKILMIFLLVAMVEQKQGSIAKTNTSTAKNSAIPSFIIIQTLQLIQYFLMWNTRLLRFLCSSAKTSDIQSKPFFKPFQQAVDLELNNCLSEANALLYESLKEIKISGEQQLEHYWHIQKRIAHNYRRLGKNRQAEKVLYEIIAQKRDSSAPDVLVYEDYDNLFKHLITYDLEKSIKLAKALVQQKSLKTPLSYVKLFNFNLGNAYLLAGNYTDAKKRLRTCLESDPQGSVKPFAYNSLGLACWWHKNPLQSQQNVGETSNVDQDFQSSIELFLKSIKVAESQANPDKLDMEITVSSRSLENQDQILQSADSLPAISNLVEFLLANDPIKRTEIIYWLNTLLETSRKTKSEKYLDRALVQQALLTNNLTMVKEVVPSMIHKYRSIKQFSEESFYAKVLWRAYQGEKEEKKKQYMDRANLIDSVLPNWVYKMKFLGFNQLNLLK